MQGKILTIFLAVALISVAIFGFLGMGIMGDTLAHTCPFSSFVSGDCALLESAASLAAHHFAVLQKLAQTMASFDILVLVFSLLFLLALFPVCSFLLKIASAAASIVYVSEESAFSQKIQLLRWLAYHNKRDYLAPIRVRVLNLRFKI